MLTKIEYHKSHVFATRRVLESHGDWGKVALLFQSIMANPWHSRFAFRWKLELDHGALPMLATEYVLILVTLSQMLVAPPQGNGKVTNSTYKQPRFKRDKYCCTINLGVFSPPMFQSTCERRGKSYRDVVGISYCG